MTKRRLSIRIILLVALFSLLLPGFALVVYKVNRVRMSPSPNSPIIGTWKSDHGYVVNYRADGTARYRGAVDGTPNQILYFEWMIDSSDNLVTYNGSSSQANAWKQRLNDWVHGYDSRQSSKLLEVADAAFTVRTAEGKEVRFVPTQDKEMESAP